MRLEQESTQRGRPGKGRWRQLEPGRTVEQQLSHLRAELEAEEKRPGQEVPKPVPDQYLEDDQGTCFDQRKEAVARREGALAQRESVGARGGGRGSATGRRVTPQKVADGGRGEQQEPCNQ